MFEFITNTENRGQVGIGTLIVFIAMVLVAAIAAGVLINTAGFLQSQAEATGQESTDLVSERIEVSSSAGIVASDGDTLEEVRITVAGAPGASDIDLTEATIQAVGPGGQENLVFKPGGSLDTSTSVPSGDDAIDVQPEIDPGASQIDVAVSTVTNTEGDYNLVLSDENGNSVTKTGGTDFNTDSVNQIDISGLTINDGETITVDLVDTVDSETDDTGTANVIDLASGISDFGAGEFGIQDSSENLQSSAVLDSNAQYQILINPDAGAFSADGSAFGEGEEATLDIVSPAGATTQVELRAPDLFDSQGEAVRL